MKNPKTVNVELRFSDWMQDMEANLIGRVNKLDPLVGDGEDDGGDLPHLFRRPLGKETEQASERGGEEAMSCLLSAPCAATHPHFGTGVLRGLGPSQVLDEHGAQILRGGRRRRSEFGRSCFARTIRPARPEKKRRRTHVGFVRARLKDEFLRLMVPVLDGGVRRRQAGGPQGQSGLSMPLLIEVLQHKNEVH